ncbi:MAG: hypothetical protein JJU33_00880 [Phycisphaerales bacterium]|nr:hypothetical protein [Phycisphaerales bacterium]
MPETWTNTPRYTQTTMIFQRPPLIVRIMLMIAIAIGFILALVVILPLAALLLILAAIGQVIARIQGRRFSNASKDKRENVKVIDRSA